MIKEPTEINFSVINSSTYFETIYSCLYGMIDLSNPEPQVDFDSLPTADWITMYEDLNIQANMRNFTVKTISTTEYNKSKAQKSLLLFLRYFPDFYIYLKNVNADSAISIQNAEVLYTQTVSKDNFIQIKSVIDRQNNLRWTRDKSMQEKNSGVSILGATSEDLLALAMEDLIDNKTFFKNTNSEVQSYGDFVLMCLPNNLWLSVKSNFARERLLASGYTTDIIGVGFFTDYREFTSQAKIRNFSKVGFLAMYLPDVPVSEEQVINNENTFDQVIAHYTANGTLGPKNINGTSFIRKLSDLPDDLSEILREVDVKKRTTITF